MLVLLCSLRPPSVSVASRHLMTHWICFARICACTLPFAFPYDVSPFSLEVFPLTCLLSTRGFVLRLDACAPADLQALVIWLVGKHAQLPMLLLVFLAQSLLPHLMAAHLNFSHSFLLLSMLLSSCYASGLCAFPCCTLMHRYTYPNILHFMYCCHLDFS
jgi:hypothetical protein